MPFTWDMTIDQTTDWSHKDFADMFVQKLALRWAATVRTGTMPPHVEAGADISGFAEWPLYFASPPWPPDGFQPWSWRAMQAMVEALGASYCPPSAMTFPLTGGLTDVPRYNSIAAIGAGANLNGGKKDGWQRRKPRQIATTTATADTDGNTVADGMVAELVAPAGTKWKRVAGAWTRFDGAPYDLLDSANSATGGSYCLPGKMEVGDYIGYWIFNELRAAINLYILTFSQNVVGWTGCDSSANYLQHFAAVGDDNDMSVLTGVLDEVWGYGGPPTSSGEGGPDFYVDGEIWHYSWTEPSFIGIISAEALTQVTHADTTPPYDSLTYYGSEVYIQVDDRWLATGVQVDATLVVQGQSLTAPDGVGSTTEYQDMYAGGAPVNMWVSYDAVQVTTKAFGDPAASPFFKKFGDATIHPDPPSATLAHNDSRGAAYEFGIFLKWGFDTYTPSAPAPGTPSCLTRCWYLLEASASCTGKSPGDAPTITVTQVDKQCDTAKAPSDAWGDTGRVNDVGRKIYQRWVPKTKCPGGLGDCPDLTADELADPSLLAGFPDAAACTACFYKIRATPVCPGTGGDPSQADYSITQIDKSCAATESSDIVANGTTADGLTIYETWVHTDTICQGLADCPDLTADQLASYASLFPVQTGCPTLTTNCFYTYLIEYDKIPGGGYEASGVTFQGTVACLDGGTATDPWAYCACSVGGQWVQYCCTVRGPTCTGDGAGDCPGTPDPSLTPDPPAQPDDATLDGFLDGCEDP